jgi:AcrR family transcriptional regulator
MIVCGAVTLQADRAVVGASDEVAGRLVEAARSLMWEAGSPSFTVSQVVAAAGSSLKSFYRCFGSKDDLLVALFADDARRGAKVLSDMVERAGPGRRLHAAVTGLFSFLGAERHLPYAAALVGEHMRLAQSRPEELTEARRPFVAVFERELAGAAQRGEIRAGDAAADARLVFHLVLAHLHALVWHTIDDGPAEVAEQVWAFSAAALGFTGGDGGGRR